MHDGSLASASALPALPSHAALDDALRSLAQELRELVANLRHPRVGDRQWLQALQVRFHDLGVRADALRDAARTRGRTLSRAVSKLREAVHTHASTLSENATPSRLQKLRATLAEAYEDLVEYMTASEGLSRAAAGLRALRLPRLMRSATHIGLGLVCVLLYELVLPWGLAMTLLGSFFGFFASLELTRRIWPRWNDFLMDRVFSGISRPQERYRVNSATWYLAALTAITAFAPQNAVGVAVLVLAFGDPIASLVGYRWGRHEVYDDKTLEGSLAFVAAATTAAFVYLLLAAPELSTLTSLGFALSAAVFGSIVELFSGRLDDNFTIPVATALFGLLWL